MADGSGGFSGVSHGGGFSGVSSGGASGSSSSSHAGGSSGASGSAAGGFSSASGYSPANTSIASQGYTQAAPVSGGAVSPQFVSISPSTPYGLSAPSPSAQNLSPLSVSSTSQGIPLGAGVALNEPNLVGATGGANFNGQKPSTVSKESKPQSEGSASLPIVTRSINTINTETVFGKQGQVLQVIPKTTTVEKKFVQTPEGSLYALPANQAKAEAFVSRLSEAGKVAPITSNTVQRISQALGLGGVGTQAFSEPSKFQAANTVSDTYGANGKIVGQTINNPTPYVPSPLAVNSSQSSTDTLLIDQHINSNSQAVNAFKSSLTNSTALNADVQAAQLADVRNKGLTLSEGFLTLEQKGESAAKAMEAAGRVNHPELTIPRDVPFVGGVNVPGALSAGIIRLGNLVPGAARFTVQAPEAYVQASKQVTIGANGETIIKDQNAYQGLMGAARAALPSSLVINPEKSYAQELQGVKPIEVTPSNYRTENPIVNTEGLKSSLLPPQQLATNLVVGAAAGELIGAAEKIPSDTISGIKNNNQLNAIAKLDKFNSPESRALPYDERLQVNFGRPKGSLEPTTPSDIADLAKSRFDENQARMTKTLIDAGKGGSESFTGQNVIAKFSPKFSEYLDTKFGKTIPVSDVSLVELPDKLNFVQAANGKLVNTKDFNVKVYSEPQVSYAAKAQELLSQGGKFPSGLEVLDRNVGLSPSNPVDRAKAVIDQYGAGFKPSNEILLDVYKKGNDVKGLNEAVNQFEKDYLEYQKSQPTSAPKLSGNDLLKIVQGKNNRVVVRKTSEELGSGLGLTPGTDIAKLGIKVPEGRAASEESGRTFNVPIPAGTVFRPEDLEAFGTFKGLAENQALGKNTKFGGFSVSRLVEPGTLPDVGAAKAVPEGFLEVPSTGARMLNPDADALRIKVKDVLNPNATPREVQVTSVSSYGDTGVARGTAGEGFAGKTRYAVTPIRGATGDFTYKVPINVNAEYFNEPAFAKALSDSKAFYAKQGIDLEFKAFNKPKEGEINLLFSKTKTGGVSEVLRETGINDVRGSNDRLGFNARPKGTNANEIVIGKNAVSLGNRGLSETISHEIGHSLGLEHVNSEYPYQLFSEKLQLGIGITKDRSFGVNTPIGDIHVGKYNLMKTTESSGNIFAKAVLDESQVNSIKNSRVLSRYKTPVEGNVGVSVNRDLGTVKTLARETRTGTYGEPTNIRVVNEAVTLPQKPSASVNVKFVNEAKNIEVSKGNVGFGGIEKPISNAGAVQTVGGYQVKVEGTNRQITQSDLQNIGFQASQKVARAPSSLTLPREVPSSNYVSISNSKALSLAFTGQGQVQTQRQGLPLMSGFSSSPQPQIQSNPSFARPQTGGDTSQIQISKSGISDQTTKGFAQDIGFVNSKYSGFINKQITEPVKEPQFSPKQIEIPRTTPMLETRSVVKTEQITNYANRFPAEQIPRQPEIPRPTGIFGGGGSGSPSGFGESGLKGRFGFKGGRNKGGLFPDPISVSRAQRATGKFGFGVPSTKSIIASKQYKRSFGVLRPTTFQLNSRSKRGF